MSVKGVYYNLFQEFEKELTENEYSMLPLVRPTSSNEKLSMELLRAKKASLDRVVQMADDILKVRSSSGTQEVVLRQGIDPSTMYQAKRHGSAQTAVDMLLNGGKSRKRQCLADDSTTFNDISDFPLKALRSKTKEALKTIASNEKITLSGTKRNKEDYVKAIWNARQARKSDSDDNDNEG